MPCSREVDNVWPVSVHPFPLWMAPPTYEKQSAAVSSTFEEARSLPIKDQKQMRGKLQERYCWHSGAGNATMWTQCRLQYVDQPKKDPSKKDDAILARMALPIPTSMNLMIRTRHENSTSEARTAAKNTFHRKLGVVPISAMLRLCCVVPSGSVG